MADEKRLIDANALLAKMKKTSRYFDIKFDIEEATTVDAVEVVRCKDCEHYCQYPKVDKPKACFVHPLTPHFMPEDGFCSNGERKENG